MKVIVGLGNPGSRYSHTPHNVGFEVIDTLAGRHQCTLRRSFRFRARTGKTVIAGHPVLFIKPVAYMNNSGPVVAAIIRKTGAAIQDLIVIVDDADLPAGQIRIRAQGSSGGHKGLQSLVEHLGEDQFIRLRLGIGRGPARLARAGQGARPGLTPAELAAYVLTPMPPAAWKEIETMIHTAADAVSFLLEYGVEAAMNAFNTRR